MIVLYILLGISFMFIFTLARKVNVTNKETNERIDLLLSILENVNKVINELNCNINGEIINGIVRREGINDQIGQIKQVTKRLKANEQAIKDNGTSVINQVLKGLPNLYKNDIDLVKKIDHPNTNTHEIKMFDDQIYVYIGTHRIKLNTVIERAEEIRNVQEKCCPKPATSKFRRNNDKN